MKKIIIGLLSVATIMTLGACKNDSTSNNTQTNKSTSQVESSVSSIEENSTSKETNISNFSISLEDAIEIYKKEVPNTDITKINIDSSFGSHYYEIEGMDDNTEYELKISVDNGEVKEKRDEKLDKDEQNGVKRNEEKLDLTNLKPLSEITETALKEAGSGEAVDWSLEKEISITYWEVNVKNGNKEHDIKINAQSGEVLSTELND